MIIVSPSQRFITDAENWWIETALEAIDQRDQFEAALSGGSTPERLYRRLATNRHLRYRWDHVGLWFGDERGVPPDDPQSNFRMVTEAGLNASLGLRMQRVEGELEPGLAAERYASRLDGLFKRAGMPVFDLIMLGMGEDGHVASLFPGSANLAERVRPVSAAYVETVGGWRISITMPVIASARRVLVLVTGENKAGMVVRAIREEDPALPATEVGRLEQAVWLLDEAAASKL